MPPHAPSQEPLSFLHVEDSPADAALIGELLAQEWPGCRIDVVQKYDEFLGAVRQGGFDLILSDFTLPGFDGFTALELARQHRPQVPFIFLSATIGEDNAVETLKLGATDYVLKDHLNRLVPVIRRALEEMHEQRGRLTAEQHMREQAELLDKARDAICVTDLGSCVTYWNQGAERLFGWMPGEVAGRPLAQLLPWLDSSVLARARHTLETDGAWVAELGVPSPAGADRIVTSNWTLVRDATGQPKSILIINADVTDQRRLEKQFQQAQRLESIGMLAGGIAHDLNNVLAPILMSVNMLQQCVTEPDLRRLLGVLETSAQHGASLIRQVLVFARGADGERTNLQPHFIIRDVVGLLGKTLPRSIVIETDLPRELWLITSNATQLGQVLMNLCVNARDAMSEGGRLTVRARNCMVDSELAMAMPGAKPGPHLLITVADTGTGISPQIIDHIFDPFFTTKSPGKGTGLGLSTVLGIMQAHGGFLRVKSEVGAGTVFSLYFPAITTIAPEMLDAAAAATAPPTRGHGETILVIDDETSVCEAARALLENQGYRVRTAADGADGIELYRWHAIEIRVVIVDLMMPAMQGADVVAALRAINPQVRMVAMSGVLEPETLGVTPEPGRLEFLPKPMEGNVLLHAVGRLLD